MQELENKEVEVAAEEPKEVAVEAPKVVAAPPKPEPVAPKRANTDAELLRRINPTTIYPPLWAKMEQLAKNCRTRGVDYWAIAGLRTVEEQNGLYAQGRSKPGKIVTNAKGGHSCHNFGLALDFAMDKDVSREGLQPDFSSAQLYKVLAEEAKKLGLEAGFYWTRLPDSPHIQLPLSRVFGKPESQVLADLRIAYAAGGLSAVWALLNKYRW